MVVVMKWRIKSFGDVLSAACLTTAAAIVVAQIQVYWLIPQQGLEDALRVAPIIVLVTAFPLCVFVWAQVRKNTHLSDELQRLLNRDRLTDVATRDFFFAKMHSNPEAYGTSLMVDIDHFKSVNDRFGHLAGDAVIARVAGILFENTREEDIVCRFGGEEFVIFLHQQCHKEGFAVAERMRKRIAEVVVPYEGENLSVTVSIGGSLKERLEDVNLAIRQADQALYRAKTGGRNRTVFVSEDGQTTTAVAV